MDRPTRSAEPQPRTLAGAAGRPALAGRVALAVVLGILAPTSAAFAYVGPGAGFALVSGFLVIFTTLVLAVVSLLVLPFRMLIRWLRFRGKTKPSIKRFIVVGFDGQSPEITDRMLADGKLPNFQKLADAGGYRRLGTVYPALSPVAWSSFSTGVNPGGHNVFDFVVRDKRNYLPQQASTEIGKLEKTFKIGKWVIPLKTPTLRLLRKSKPFWKILGENNVWSTVLRVPVTFPPEKFYGAQLSAMMTPDLLGTLGSFFHFSSRTAENGTIDETFKEGGISCVLHRDGNDWIGTLEGPPNSFIEGDPALTLPVRIRPNGDRARITLGKEETEIATRELSDWMVLTFKAAPGINVSGTVRIMLTELGEHCGLYITPINIDAENPAMPISHPSYYSTYLAKKVGQYSTLGLAEDTVAMNEGITDDATFLEQSLDIDDERRRMFLSALSKLRKGTITCVFDATDRIQHMFWRYIEAGHPADDPNATPEHRRAIEDLYIKNDRLVGEVMGKLRKGDVLCVISDHGFSSFRRGINLNQWLLQNGYLALKEGATGRGDLLLEVDWSKTRAYCLGLAGMFINTKGREAQGIVDPKDVASLKQELAGKLNGLRDEERDYVAINELFDTAEIYSGPYVGDAPDFIIGFNEGYRTSWDCANGIVGEAIFTDNAKPWSGDHGVDPRLVPGIFFCNHPIAEEHPSILDFAPSILTLFGIDPPKHMEGKSLFRPESFQTS